MVGKWSVVTKCKPSMTSSIGLLTTVLKPLVAAEETTFRSEGRSQANRNSDRLCLICFIICFTLNGTAFFVIILCWRRNCFSWAYIQSDFILKPLYATCWPIRKNAGLRCFCIGFTYQNSVHIQPMMMTRVCNICFLWSSKWLLKSY